MSTQFDFVAVGDIVTDAFIRLKDAHVHCKIDTDACELCLSFGDKVPYESSEEILGVGNSPNAAVSASRLGLATALITDLGNDDIGHRTLGYLRHEKINTDLISSHKGFQSNYHYVLWFDSDRTILVRHFDYPYHFPAIPSPKWLYLSSLGERSLPYHEEIASFLEKNPAVHLAFQPGTFQMKIGASRLKKLYERSHLFFCNREEAMRILGTHDDGIGKLLHGIRGLGPKIPVITDGAKGAYAYDEGALWFMPPYPDPKPPLERTGAGDAFASTLASFVALGLPIEEALLRAPINSMSVVQYIGAQRGLLSREKLEEFLQHAPADYKPVKIVE